ncbi:hypothetical protein [Arcobacter sp. s6]|uniref:hypothetical protein n=1 Tax=Arcobacter sp. s6 TaxID=3230363 RepID=UPI0034A02F2A
MRFERDYTEEERELNSIFFNDELIRIFDIIDIFLQVAYIYDFKEKKFIFYKNKVEILNLEINEKEKKILESSENIYFFVEELHNMFLDNHTNNLKIGNFIDWANKLVSIGLKNQNKTLSEIINIERALLEINEELYKKYSASYKNVLNDMVEKSYQKCIKKIQKKEFEHKINKLDNVKYFTKLEDDNKDRFFFENEISKIIEINKDDLFDIFYEINTYIEFDLILIFLENAIQMKNLPKKDPNHESRKRQGKFINKKNQFINVLKELGLDDEANIIKNEINFKKTEKNTRNLQDRLKGCKELLYYQLINHAKTPIYRAKKIIRIVNYLNF